MIRIFFIYFYFAINLTISKLSEIKKWNDLNGKKKFLVESFFIVFLLKLSWIIKYGKILK